jgi:hypothetical protein
MKNEQWINTKLHIKVSTTAKLKLSCSMNQTSYKMFSKHFSPVLMPYPRFVHLHRLLHSGTAIHITSEIPLTHLHLCYINVSPHCLTEINKQFTISHTPIYWLDLFIQCVITKTNMRLRCKRSQDDKKFTVHIKIFTDGCNSIQFDWINKYTVPLWLYKSPCRSRHVVSCLRQSVSYLSTVKVQYLAWWTISVTQEACRTENVLVNLQC